MRKRNLCGVIFSVFLLLISVQSIGLTNSVTAKSSADQVRELRKFDDLLVSTNRKINLRKRREIIAEYLAAQKAEADALLKVRMSFQKNVSQKHRAELYLEWKLLEARLGVAEVRLREHRNLRKESPSRKRMP